MPTTSRRTFVGLGGGVVAAALSASASNQTSSVSPAVPAPESAQTHYRTLDVNGCQMFYREAGPAGAPVVLLLHGFPTSSRMFRKLIPMLADKCRVIAPDYPAFGHSGVPSRSDFQYTHAHLSEVVEALIGKLGVTGFAMYVMDFGGPIGYRLMLKYPGRVTAVAIQNVPIFGVPTDGPFWAAELAYWKDGSPEHREVVRSKLTPDAIRNQYVAGTREPSLLDPDNWTIDSALLARPGVDEIMLDLLHDIRNKAQTVAEARQFFKAHQRQVMIVTGVNDLVFPRQYEASGGHVRDRVSPDRQRSLCARGPLCRNRITDARFPWAGHARLKRGDKRVASWPLARQHEVRSLARSPRGGRNGGPGGTLFPAERAGRIER
jgi:pimeloyl-ACP methyl ester carboxylesterase